jgi:guanosine-3',5'-bis(diphosphate) 3'-pyrophosphohydrolase
MENKSKGIALVIQAAHFAADKHRDQRRKGVRNTPYINHPLEVAERLNRVAGIEDPTVLAAAILHDTIEDTETTQAELERVFGKTIAELVVELSDPVGLTWQARKRHEIDHAQHLSPTAKMIKLADKTCNVADTVTNPPGEWTLSRRRDYLEFAELVAAGCKGVNRALEEDFVRVLAHARERIG